MTSVKLLPNSFKEMRIEMVKYQQILKGKEESQEVIKQKCLRKW